MLHLDALSVTYDGPERLRQENDGVRRRARLRFLHSFSNVIMEDLKTRGVQVLIEIRTGPGKAARSEAASKHQIESGSILFLVAGKLAA